jgi:signal transduction histidine kinase
MFGIQEWVLEFRLGYLGRYWALMSAASLFLGFLLSSLIVVPLLINLLVDPFRFPDNIILCAIAAVIFGILISLGQWLILRKTELTPRIFAPINTVVGILSFAVLVYFNEPHLEWRGGTIQGWKFALIFLAGGAVTGAVTGKALDFYCGRVEQRLIKLERERVEQETQERERLLKERIEKEKLEQERLEAEIAERKRIQREAAQEEERLWYEQHGKDYADYEYDEEEEE